jgi:hypothetical protein
MKKEFQMVPVQHTIAYTKNKNTGKKTQSFLDKKI